MPAQELAPGLGSDWSFGTEPLRDFGTLVAPSFQRGIAYSLVIAPATRSRGIQVRVERYPTTGAL